MCQDMGYDTDNCQNWGHAKAEATQGGARVGMQACGDVGDEFMQSYWDEVMTPQPDISLGSRHAVGEIEKDPWRADSVARGRLDILTRFG